MRKVSEAQKKASRKRAWTKYNRSKKHLRDNKRYYQSHKEERASYNKKWEKENPDKIKEYQKRSRRKRILSGKDKAWRDRLAPVVKYAKDAANNALRSGKLKRETRCEMCGKEGLLHKHHNDYHKPLEVVWLCPKCHKEVYN